jgi:molybdopterin-guanine dinucleotide biosynthesis protein A
MSGILGAVLAGGRSSRFGSDKARAVHGGRPLLAHVVQAMAGQVAAVVVCGRPESGLAGVAALPDRPSPDLGPLGGLNAALAHARDYGYDAVFTAGCDTPVLPADIVARLAAAGSPAMVAQMPVIGLWPSSLAAQLDAHVADGGDMSLRRWGRSVGAVLLAVDDVIPNINTPDDLARLGPLNPP